MKGLLIKDLIVLKGQAKILLLIIAIYLVMTVYSGGDMTMYHSMGTMIFSVLVITALAFDERSGWDKYALTMPLGRKALVYSKYILTFLFPTVFLLINLLIKQLFFGGLTFESAKTMILVTCIGLFYISIILPIAFRLGTEKSRLLMLLIVFLPAAGVFAFTRIASDSASSIISNISEGFTELYSSYFVLFPAVSLCLLLASMLISLRIYKKKEF